MERGESDKEERMKLKGERGERQTDRQRQTDTDRQGEVRGRKGGESD